MYTVLAKIRTVHDLVLGWQEHTPRPEGARPCARANRFGTVLNPAFYNKNGKEWNRQSEGPHINHVV